MTIDYNIEILISCHTCSNRLEAYRRRNDDWRIYPCESCEKTHLDEKEDLKKHIGELSEIIKEAEDEK